MAALSAIALSLAPAGASADTFCVTPAGGCDVAHTKTTLTAALSATQANPGADTIQLGAATYAEDGLTATDADPLTIVGVGPATVIERATPSPSAIVLELNGAGAITLSQLKLHINAASGNEAIRVDGNGGGMFSGVQVDADPTATSPEGFNAFSGTGTWRLTSSSIALPVGGDCVATSAATTIVSDSSLSGCSTGINAQGGTVTAQRLRIDAGIGVDVGGTTTARLDDSVVTASGEGVLVGTSAASASIIVNQDTLIGPGSGGTGVECFSHVGGPGEIGIYDTIVRGFAISLSRDDIPGHSCRISGEYNDYSLSSVSNTGTGSGEITSSHVQDNVDPLFVNAPGGDYRLSPSSPVVDLDPAALVATESPTDLIGTLRFINGARDLGAYEQPLPATATTAPVSSLGQAGATLNGSANTGGAIGTVEFQYGPTASYGGATPLTAVPAATTATNLSAAIGGLAPATVYHYAVLLRTPYGTFQGADQTFTTAATLTGGGGGSGFQTPTGVSPPTAASPQTCHVPRLAGLSLAKARLALTKAGCKLGRVKRPKQAKKSHKHQGTLVVVHQSLVSGTSQPSGARVDVTLGSVAKVLHKKKHR